MRKYMENGKQYRRYTYEFVKNRAIEEGYPEYELLSTTYKTRKDKLLWIHKECNNTFLMDADGFFNRKNRCPHCNGGHRLTSADFAKRVSMSKNGDEYTILSEYKNTHDYVTFKHNKCNNIFTMRPNNFLIKGNRCPYCAEKMLGNHPIKLCHSDSEETIKKWIESRGLKYEREVKFKETGRLRFDFKIYKSESTFILVEFDGRFHRPPRDGSSITTLEKYKRQKENDSKKDKFCIDKNIKLIRATNIKTMIKRLSDEFNDYPNGGEIPQ